jgi:hypothetical protein
MATHERKIYAELMRHSGIVLLCAVVAPLVHAATVYRWVDDNGVVNYTQQKPKDVSGDAEVDEVEIKVSSIITTDDTAPAPTSDTPAGVAGSETASDSAETGQQELSEAQQQELEELKRREQARLEEQALARAEKCEKARALLERLTINNRIRLRQPDGTEVALGEDERQQRIAATQQEIAVNCVPDRRARSARRQ